MNGVTTFIGIGIAVVYLAFAAFNFGSDCNIKGNVSRNGERIYHVPGDKYYWDTMINPLNGEKWFCSEGEARDAGWRRARR